MHETRGTSLRLVNNMCGFIKYTEKVNFSCFSSCRSVNLSHDVLMKLAKEGNKPSSKLMEAAHRHAANSLEDAFQGFWSVSVTTLELSFICRKVIFEEISLFMLELSACNVNGQVLYVIIITGEMLSSEIACCYHFQFLVEGLGEIYEYKIWCRYIIPN